MKLPNVVLISHPDLRYQQVFVCTKPPYVMGKLVRIEDQSAGMDYDRKQVTYSIKRIPGYNMFIIYAGLMGGNEKVLIPDKEIELAMTSMVNYYKNDVLPNLHNVKRKYTIK